MDGPVRNWHGEYASDDNYEYSCLSLISYSRICDRSLINQLISKNISFKLVIVYEFLTTKKHSFDIFPRTSN